MSELIGVEEKEIRQILASHYGVREDDICFYNDYRFVRKGDDKVREDFVYAIVDKSNGQKLDKNTHNVDEVIRNLKIANTLLCDARFVTDRTMHIRIGQAITEAINILSKPT